LRIRAVCVRCGTVKQEALAACAACDYTPESEYEVARALILSKRFAVGDVSIGRPDSELEAIGEQIRGGRPYYFDPEEQRVVIEAYRSVAQAKSSRRTSRFLKWLVPVLLILGLLVALLWPR
jgi:hypothetical protein